MFPNTASKLNSAVPIPCFTIFTFTVVSPKAGVFAGALNKPALLVWTCAFLGTTSLPLNFPSLAINSVSTLCSGSNGSSSLAANAGLMVPIIITIASRKESNLDLVNLFNFLPPLWVLSYSDC